MLLLTKTVSYQTYMIYILQSRMVKKNRKGFK